MAPIELCGHGMNPRSCPTCWQAQASMPVQKKVAIAIPASAAANVMPLGEAVMRSTQGAEARARIAAQTAKMAEAKQGAVHVEDEPEHYTKDGLWQPAERKQLIDSLPKHPHAQEGAIKVLR